MSLLKELKPDDPVRMKVSDQLLEKLYLFGAIPTRSSIHIVERLSTSAFAKRRLPVIMVRSKMAENIKEAVTFVEQVRCGHGAHVSCGTCVHGLCVCVPVVQGHVRVGPEVVTDPAFIVTRSMEDFVTWVDSSKIKRAVEKYNDKLDDFDLLGN